MGVPSFGQKLRKEGREVALRTEELVQTERIGDNLRATDRVAMPPRPSRDMIAARQPVTQENQPDTSRSTPD